ncbi:hypothetical protein [Magnetospirillum sp. XM-1]|uniref:hypothetical protein n=1 Tax=Magnetospirillum sp. XM-1 TaxID=1663591 RepID=UPI0012E368C7|nr:hypothetical protein [Magnetospirillum sp. XM-1]
MPYRDLYEICQKQSLHIPRNFIKSEVLRLTGKEKIRVVCTDSDPSLCRGMFISFGNNESNIARQCGCDVIVLARGMNRCWQRIVYIKELMHLFDAHAESTFGGHEFDTLLSEMSGAETPTRSPQWRSEIKAFWMALACLCPEDKRINFMELRKSGKIDDYSIALQLRIPQQYVPRLFQQNYGLIIQEILNNGS